MTRTNPRAHITQICLSTADGGLEMSVVTVAKAFAKNGYRSACICAKGGFIEKALSVPAVGVDVCAIDFRRKYFDWRASAAIRRYLRANATNAVVLHMLRDMWIVYPSLWRLAGVRAIGICRMFLRNVNKNDVLHRILYGRFQHVVALSTSQKTELLKCVPLKAERCSVIPNAVDTKRFSPRARNEDLRRQWGVAPNQVVLGFVGRLDRQKGLLELVTSISLIKNVHRPKLIIVGSETIGEPGFQAELTALIERFELEDQVILVPARADVPEVMSAFDIFIMPSYEEAFGKVLLEAMACGLPCIATNAGGPIDLLKAGEVGVLVEPKSADALAVAITTLAADAQLRETLGRLSRKVAVEQYNEDAIFRQLESVVVG